MIHENKVGRYPWYNRYKDLPLDSLECQDITILEIPTRAINCLLREGIITIGRLIERGPLGVKMIRGLGRISYDEIDIALHLLGFNYTEDGWVKRNQGEACTTTK